LDEKPAISKTLEGAAAVTASSAGARGASTVAGATGEVTYNARHAEIEIKLSGNEGISQGDTVSGVCASPFGDRHKMALRTISELWRATEIGAGLPDALCGKTITNIRYTYTRGGRHRLPC
jgi:hypothetical protein